MHYAIAYDLEHDRLRGAVARLLERHGCRRVQKSVFVGAHLTKKGSAHLLADLGRLTKGRLGPSDSILVIPLAPMHAGQMVTFGSNIASALFLPPALFFRTES